MLTKEMTKIKAVEDVEDLKKIASFFIYKKKKP